MQLLPAGAARCYQACGLEDAQVLHRGEARDARQGGVELGDRLAVLAQQRVEQPSGRAIPWP
jgi:hypothetical protein